MTVVMVKEDALVGKLEAVNKDTVVRKLATGKKKLVAMMKKC